MRGKKPKKAVRSTMRLCFDLLQSAKVTVEAGMTVLSGVEVVAESMLAVPFLRWHPLHSSTPFFLLD